MAQSDDSFLAWRDRFRTGDEAAADELFERFTRQLLRLAQHELAPFTRPKVDPEDIVQSVYKSFFLRYKDGNLPASNWGSLWGLLTVITLRKCADRAEYYQAARRDAAREVVGGADDERSNSWQEAIDLEPTPLQATLLAETVEHLLRSLEDDERSIIELSLQGYSVGEISAQLGRAERTVRRVRERIKRRLERQQREGARNA
jgi:RNA polymerase sigma-70 factor (ECF subfamily)